MIQGFYWDVTPGGVWYNYLSDRAPLLGGAGFHSIWLPPPSRGAAGPWDVGYTPYDYYDLGEFNGPTRYGSRMQLQQAIADLKSRGLKIYMDIVLNHRSGGSLEPNIHAQWFTNRGGGSLYSPDGINTFTAFPLPNGSGRISWPVGGGNEFFFPNSVQNPWNTGDFFSDAQLLGFHQMYTNSFAYSNALHRGNGTNLPMGDSLFVWADWLTRELDLDGYRFDFVKGIHPEYFKRFMKHGAMQGKFHVHELYDGSMQRKRDYITLVNTGFNNLSPSSPPNPEGRIFDFNLRFAYKEWSDGGINYDIRNLHGRGLFNQSGVLHEHIATFVENHDFDRIDHTGNATAPGHSPIVNQKNLIYAHMMTHPGYATVWWRDYFYYGLQDDINLLLAIRNRFASGGHQILTARGDVFWPGTQSTDERHVYVMQRNGHNNQTGMIAAINKHPNFDIDVWVTNIRDDWRNRDLKDITGNVQGTTRVFNDSRVLIRTRRNSYSVWVPVDYEFSLPVGVSVDDIRGLHDLYLTHQPVAVDVRVRSEGISHQNATITYSVKNHSGATILEESQQTSLNPFQERTLAVPSISLSEPGIYTITASITSTNGGTQPIIERQIEVVSPEDATFPVYLANMREGSGGVVGFSSIFAQENGNAITFTFNKGSGSLNDMLVIYLHTGQAGRTVIDQTINDVGDSHRRSISMSGTSGSTIHFPEGFEASHALAFNTNFGGLWRIPSSGTITTGGLQYLRELGNPVSADSRNFSFTITRHELGLQPDEPLNFVALYVNSVSAALSNEGFGFGLPTSNPAGDTVRLSGYYTWPDAQAVIPVRVTGSEGWRIFASPLTNFTVGNLAESNLVQGVGGSYAGAVPNVFLGYTGNASENTQGIQNGWIAASDVSQALNPGAGFLWYLYDNDLVPECKPLPFLLSAKGLPPMQDIVIPLHSNGNRLNLIGNPFPEAIDVTQLTTWAVAGSVQAVVHLWDNSIPGGSWVTAGSASAGKMAPWQGGLIENNTASQLNIPRTARTVGGTLLDVTDESLIQFKLEGTNGQLTRTDASFSILFHEDASSGWDLWDASKLQSLSNEYVSLSVMGIREGKSTYQSRYSLPFDFLGMYELPLYVASSGISGEFTISWVLDDQLPGELSINLVDKKTGIRTDIRKENSYSFVFDATVTQQSGEGQNTLPQLFDSEGEERFVLLISSQLNDEFIGDLPQHVTLHQNYPNPFNPITQIAFEIPERTTVRLEVFNIQGQRIATLLNGEAQPGSYAIPFDGSQLASGVYLYRLSVGQTILTRKMTLVK